LNLDLYMQLDPASCCSCHYRAFDDRPISGLQEGQACSELNHHLDGLLSRFALGLMLMTAYEWQSSSMSLHILLHASLI